MDPALRLAWTQIVTADDYDQHMANVGQAQACAVLNADVIRFAALPEGSSVIIVGAGTGQMFEFLDPELLRPLRLTCTDLNPCFLARLEERLTTCGLSAGLLTDDIEQTKLEPGADLLMATLLLEHIDWRRGVDVLCELHPETCALIIQENPEGMSSAVTPGRQIPPSIAKAVEFAHPSLVPREELVKAFEHRGYRCAATFAQDVLDGKCLAALIFRR